MPRVDGFPANYSSSQESRSLGQGNKHKRKKAQESMALAVPVKHSRSLLST